MLSEAATNESVEELPIIEQPPQDPPKPEDCPPCKSGSPAWMATFADMATLLMAFFVLILSFAHVNVPKYKEVSGSMKSKFGVQAMINMGVAVRLLPAKGMTLPFVSYGGSSLIAGGIAMGMLLALTRTRPQGKIGDILMRRTR